MQHTTVDPIMRQRFIRRPLSLVGLAFASVTYGAALVPSLLPRPLTFLIFLTALGTVGGYALGSLVSWALHRSLWIRRHRLRTWIGVVIVIALWIPSLVATPIAITWQAEQQSLLDMPSTLPGSLILVVAVLAASALLLLLGRSIRLLTAALATAIGRIPPLQRRLGRTGSPGRRRGVRLLRLGVAVALVAVFALAATAGFQRLVASYDAVNADTSGQDRSRIGTNSGGRGSLVSWETLGRQGRAFVDNPMTPAQITAISRQPAVDPLRLYIGMQQAATPQERSDLAVRELDRSGAWQRKYLAIFVVTGTGWVDPNGVNSLEAVTGGDIATVAVQYSAVPSWIGFVIDPQTAMDQGASQVQTIVSAWKRQPAATRPQLILFGQSLGAFGSQAAWSAGTTPEQVVADIPKVIWVGPPAQSRLWERWQADRSGGPAWQPVIGNGRLAQVYVTPQDLADAVPRTGPAITYVAHANDPVVYWSPSLLLNHPDWIAAPLGPGVDPHLEYYFGLTFLSVGFDLISGGEPPEVGHNYSANIAPAVAITLATPGWTKAATARLQAALPSLVYPTD
ncbi:MAG: alpha/beta-hydrolase family protein [Candidatus Nanopelagicales bacterium]|nr:alpha/beta-hydrolase family protein [Candidatus Nanopelagicales bacterium]